MHYISPHRCILSVLFQLLLLHCSDYTVVISQWRTQEFCSGGIQQIQLRTEDRENRDLEAVAP